MEGPARGCLAGLISWKLGGGVFSDRSLSLSSFSGCSVMYAARLRRALRFQRLRPF